MIQVQAANVYLYANKRKVKYTAHSCRLPEMFKVVKILKAEKVSRSEPLLLINLAMEGSIEQVLML